MITDRLNGTAPSAVATHLLQLALRAFLQDDVVDGRGCSVSTNLFAVCCCLDNDKLEDVCDRMKIWNSGISSESVCAVNAKELEAIGQDYTPQNTNSQSAGKRQKVHHKLKKDLRLMVPASRKDIDIQLKQLGGTQKFKNSAWQSQLVSIMTIVCHDFAKEAKKNGRNPCTHHFQPCTGSPMLVDMTADSESSNVGSPMVVDTTIEIPSVVSAMFQVYTSLQRLVSFLCQGTEETNDYVEGCSMLLLAGKGLFGPGTLPSDLWRAAFYAHYSTRFEITHGSLNLPIRATIVPASTQEYYGTVDNTVEVRDRKIKPDHSKVEDVRLPRLLHYISCHGGWGVFTLERTLKANG